MPKKKKDLNIRLRYTAMKGKKLNVIHIIHIVELSPKMMKYKNKRKNGNC
jgi:hypothetical protein